MGTGSLPGIVRTIIHACGRKSLCQDSLGDLEGSLFPSEWLSHTIKAGFIMFDVYSAGTMEENCVPENYTALQGRGSGVGVLFVFFLCEFCTRRRYWINSPASEIHPCI